MSGVRCAVGLPNVGDYGDPRLLVELAQMAEDAGWDGVFVWDHVAYRERGWPVSYEDGGQRLMPPSWA